LATITVEQRYCRPTTINDNPLIASDASNEITDAEGNIWSEEEVTEGRQYIRSLCF